MIRWAPLFLQRWYALSDEGLEEAQSHRLSSRRWIKERFPSATRRHVARRDLALVLERPFDVGLDQARIDQRAGLNEQIFRYQLSVQCSKQSLPHLSRDRRQTEAAASGVSSSRENSHSRRNDKRSDNASSSPSSDSAYQRCSNSAFSMASGGYDVRPHAPDRTGMTNAASGAQSII